MTIDQQTASPVVFGETGERARAALSSHLTVRNLVERHTELAALRTLYEVMCSNGWVAIHVDIEECSAIETLALADGERCYLGADNDLEAINDVMFEVVGNCPRRIFRYLDGQYWADRGDVRAAINSALRAQVPAGWPPIG
ncbi:hypothetical protein [Gordonia sp. SMJS1]|uniref:hypothetical protein n=1 Tax=Gordonia sp. SMJS1 TaxID=3039400 RepID=UPI0024572C88|nr:hypothetical protein [Gordonia sp. SMJS1]WGJ88293.1 hypothetical protein QAD21_25260 [Gordonia sp. SMJS1]